MSGRGRGRGRGRGAPPSGAKLLLMRSAQESGLGENNLNSLADITRPALFPDLNWNYFDDADAVQRSRQASTVYLINKGREIDHRIQTSSHWVRPSQTQVDVVRYKSDKKNHHSSQTPPDVAVLDQMGKNLAMDDTYIPAELVSSKRVASRKRPLSSDINASSAPKTGTLDALEQKERQRRIEEARQANVLEEDLEGQYSDAPPDEEEDEVEDYTTNYYESEDESDGGEGAEATY